MEDSWRQLQEAYASNSKRIAELERELEASGTEEMKNEIRKRRIQRSESTDFQQLWVKLNRPSASRFLAELKRRGIHARLEDIQGFVRQPAAELFQAGAAYRGHVISMHLDQKWAADIINQSDGPSLLIVQDVFSRYAWGAVLRNMSAQSLVSAFEDILTESKRSPQRLITDKGTNFASREFKRLCDEHKIDHQFKVGRNDIATVDRLIYTVKRSQAQDRVAGDKRELQEILDGYNETGHPALMGSAPADVPENPLLRLELARGNDMLRARNDELAAKRAKKLLEFGAFRVLTTSRSRFSRRSFLPRWSERVYKVDRVEGATVYSGDESFPTKEVLPVPSDSPDAIRETPMATKTKKQREILHDFSEKVLSFLEGKPPQPSSRITVFLRGEAGYAEALREAQVPRANETVYFLKLFPEYFDLKTKGTTTTVSIVK